MSEFKPFAVAVNQQFNKLSKHELFTAGSDTDELWERYLTAFPDGTNPIYKTRTEHDCSCCRNFVKNVGNAVAIINGEIHTVWENFEGLESPYREVAQAMHGYVMSKPLDKLFRRSEPSYGAEITRQTLDGGEVKRWNHFYCNIDSRHHTREVGQAIGEFDATVGVFKRGLEELSADAFTTVLDLIAQKNLYRGEEHLRAIQAFQKHVRAYGLLTSNRARKIYVYSNATDPSARFRNTVIGTLLQDLSSGVDIETAVRSFETKVAPANYKRTTALITPRMVQDAMKTITDLGLEPALNRRFANIGDVTVNNVLWVDNSVKSKMKGGVEGLLLDAAQSRRHDTKAPAKDISIDQFMSKVLPRASSMSVLLKNTHLGNFVSLTAPADEDVAPLFKWDNNFAWSYDGNITDSIREKVKRAGGNVDAKLRFSLEWYNTDDLDLHVRTPNGSRIYFGSRRAQSGVLDVDANGMDGIRPDPVENCAFTQPVDGVYSVSVNQYSRRQTDNVGFVVEVADGSGVRQFSHPEAVGSSGTTVEIGTFTVKNGVIVQHTVGSKRLRAEGIPQEKWGVKTEQLVAVQTVMYSPNYWDDNAVGNKHWFFFLEGCSNPEPTRGIYNEFLNSRLDRHRKVFEVLGNRTKCPVVDRQLSGLGFSSTRGDTVTIAVVSDNTQTFYNVSF